MSGPSSAKAGMQGNSDSSDGCNCIYDEMIDELTDSDGSNRTEYWKMILLKREYVYNKPIVTKTTNGSEVMRTMKLRTPHQETHCVCTNRGPAFTKGKEEPSEVKSALIDRAVVQFVRTLGNKTHSDDEFKANMATSAVKRKVKAFRILTCLMGLTKMLIYRQPYFRPDMALAQKMWDEWDEGPKGLDRGFGLPKPSPRKNIKRMENCVTMCVLDAVAEVFFFKQTAHKFDCSKLDAEDKCKPFDIKMLWEVITILQPTPEIIHEAWSMGLEYNIGTSAMGFNATTALGDCFEYNLADYLRKPYLGKVAEKLMDRNEVETMGYLATTEAEKANEGEGEGEENEDADASADADAGKSTTTKKGTKKNSKKAGRPQPPRGGDTLHRFMVPSSMDTGLLPELDPRFGGNVPFHADAIPDDEVKRITKQLRVQREMRSSYRHHCSRTTKGNQLMTDAGDMVDEVMREMNALELNLDVNVSGGPHNEIDDEEIDEEDESLSPKKRALCMWKKGEPPSPCSGEVYKEYHRLRALEFPGENHCPRKERCPSHDCDKECPYCHPECNYEAEAELESAPMSLWQSAIFPTQVAACIHYKPQVLIQWCCGEAAYIDTNSLNSHTATRKGARWQYKERGSAQGGSRRWDQAWKVLKNTETWFKLACMTHGGSGKTCAQFDFHVDGLKDCFYLMSTRDNSRRVCEDPWCGHSNMPENAFWDNQDQMVTTTSVLFKMQDFKPPGKNRDANDVNTAMFQAGERDSGSAVPNCEFQARLDARFRAGKLPALNVLVSNRVTNSPPIRFNGVDLEVSVTALDDHYCLLAEAVMACSQIEGLKNQQEVFCHGQPGPDGLSSPHVALRKRSLSNEDDNHTLPYAYDILPMFISITMAKMLYDDYAEKYVTATVKDMSKSINLCTTPDDLPHHSLRYIGLGEANRQTVSLPRQFKKPDGQAYVEAGDPTETESDVSMAHVSRSIGRRAKPSDLREHISRKQGSRAMHGVRGDLFAYSTWLKHAATTLESRGLLEGSYKGTAYASLVNKGSCLSARVVELASEKKMGRYGKMKLTVATPGTYQAIAKEKHELPDVQPEKPVKKKRRDVFAPMEVATVACLLEGMNEENPNPEKDRCESMDTSGEDGIQLDKPPQDCRRSSW